MADIGTAVT